MDSAVKLWAECPLVRPVEGELRSVRASASGQNTPLRLPSTRIFGRNNIPTGAQDPRPLTSSGGVLGPCCERTTAALHTHSDRHTAVRDDTRTIV